MMIVTANTVLHEMSQARYNSPFQQSHDFTAEMHLPEHSNPHSLAPEHMPLNSTLYYYSEDGVLLDLSDINVTCCWRAHSSPGSWPSQTFTV